VEGRVYPSTNVRRGAFIFSSPASI
jgi:hypothetical protein